MANWPKRMMEVWDVISQWSKDSTKTAAIITDSNFCIISTGFNGFPRGIDDDVPERHERPTKYFFSEHGERNAIYTAARLGIALEGKYIFFRWYPCSACVRAMIQCGFARIYCNKPDFTIPHWGEDFVAADAMLKESPIEVIYLEDIGVEEYKYKR